MMTEQQAWKYLAKKWKDAANKGDDFCMVKFYGSDPAPGICKCIYNMLSMNIISKNVFEKMKRKLRKYRRQHRVLSCYFWTFDKEGAKAARIEISTIKFFVANVLQRVLDRAIQTHGALGITDYTVLAFWYRHERAARIYDGPDEVHKSALARQILKHYGLEIKEL